jgi:AcrR family transcriptional regulator
MSEGDRSDPAVEPGRSARKRRSILDAAADLFLDQGYLGTAMDDVAARAQVSKQTVYKQFSSKEALFLAVISGMTGEASDRVQDELGDPPAGVALEEHLTAHADRQLGVVLTPRLMQLRRVVIGEAGRFPELGQALYDCGPGRAISGLATAFARWTAAGLLSARDPHIAATHFNWLVMGESVNKAMLLGDGSAPDALARQTMARSGVRVFLAAYGVGAEGVEGAARRSHRT